MKKNALSRRYFILASVLLLAFVLLTFWIAMSGAGSGSVNRLDRSIENNMVSFRTDQSLVNVMLAITDIGSPQVALVIVILLFFIIMIVRHKRVIELFLLGIVGGELLALIIKMVIERSRPVNVFMLAAQGYSYPSVHALLSVILFGGIAFLADHFARGRAVKWLITIISICLIFLVGFSRIFLGVHFATDVLGGWLLGGSILLFIAAIFKKIHIHKKDELKML